MKNPTPHNGSRKVSANGRIFIQQWEGLRLNAYRCPAGHWTIGYGSTRIFGRPVHHDDKITALEAEQQFLLQLTEYENIVLQNIQTDLNQNQFDALVSHTYNTGGSETLFHLINTQAAKEEIKHWMETRFIIANGVVLNGLIKRRSMEAELFFKE
jgi:lysozyme